MSGKKRDTKTFGTMTDDLLAMLDWIKKKVVNALPLRVRDRITSDEHVNLLKKTILRYLWMENAEPWTIKG